jgi:hypothetical protein
MTARHNAKRAARRAAVIAGADWHRILTSHPAPRRDWFTAALCGIIVAAVAAIVGA